jgi:hypothetical protein
MAELDTTETRSSTRSRVPWGTVAVLVLAVIGSMVHQYGPRFTWDGFSLRKVDPRLWEWYIEDAAISFAYARNWAVGDGLVAFPGGERIEGYSNPLWVLLMAGFYLIGIDGFASSKAMAMVFGGATVIVAWRVAAEAIEDDESNAALIAPVVLAMYPQFAFWNASGLENSLFNLLLGLGIWRTVVEAKRGGFPWSAVAYLGLACTRPDGIMYAAWGGFLGMCFSLMRGRGMLPTVKWLLVFWIPFTTYFAIRYTYFAWAFPNTYYAKLGNRAFKPFAWGQRGWKYLRNWATESGIGWFLPVFVAGITGLRGWRKWMFPAATFLLTLCFIFPNSEITNAWSWWPSELPNPSWWTEARVWLLFSVVLALPLMSMGGRGWETRVLCWGSALITAFFTLRSMGDWMNGFRWMSFVSIPMATLFAAGTYEIADIFQRLLGRSKHPGWSTPGWLVATVLVLALGPGFFKHSEAFFNERETGPFSVKKRVEYTDSVAKRMYLEGRVLNLDVDMGAHMYWSEHHMLDMAGLVDITIAQHNYKQREVTREHVFDQGKPEIAHVHGGWATNSKIPTFDEWKNGYIEIPGFGGRTLHMGNHIRRDLLMKKRWRGPRERIVHFNGGVMLAGFNLPSPEISVGKALFMEIGVQYRRVDAKEDVRLVAFVSNEEGKLHSFDLPLAYDWLPPSEWRTEEVFHGKYAPVLDKSLAPGLYDLGFVFLAADGTVLDVAVPELPDGELPDLPAGVEIGGVTSEARFADGEVRFTGVLRIGPPGTGERGAKTDFDRAVQSAQEFRCREAESHWRLAWQHIPRAEKWKNEHRLLLQDDMAMCWAEMAKRAQDLVAAASMLESGRWWNHRNETLQAAEERIGDALYERAMEAHEQQLWQQSFDLFLATVQAKPWHSWARRYAEEARDYRLGIDPDSVAREEAEREERLRKLREEQAQRNAERAKQQADGAVADGAPGKDGSSAVKEGKAKAPAKQPAAAPAD